MEEQTTVITPQPTEPTVYPQPPKSDNRFKIIKWVSLAIVLLVAIIDLAKFGAQYLKRQNAAKPIVTPTQAPILDETANWKTYTAKTFSVKYPDIWNEPKSFLQSTRTEYVFNPESLDIVEGSYYDQTLGRPRTFNEEIKLGEQYSESKKEVNVGGATGVKFYYKNPERKTTVIFSSKNGLIYWISMDIPTSSDEILFDQILSTFKFINVDKNTNIMEVKLYYHDINLDPGLNDPQANNYVVREIPKTTTPLKDTIELLIQEMTKEDGVDYGDRVNQFTLKKATIVNGVATLEFDDPGHYTSGGSTRIAIMKSRFIKTAKQFPSVKEVKLVGVDFQP